nr:hypothetical protein [Odoribacter sp. OF09-27XD]
MKKVSENVFPPSGKIKKIVVDHEIFFFDLVLPCNAIFYRVGGTEADGKDGERFFGRNFMELTKANQVRIFVQQSGCGTF